MPPSKAIPAPGYEHASSWFFLHELHALHATSAYDCDFIEVTSSEQANQLQKMQQQILTLKKCYETISLNIFLVSLFFFIQIFNLGRV